MTKQVIKLRVKADGTINIDTVQNGGKKCLDTIKRLNEHLGGDIDEESVKRTPDFNKKVDNTGTVDVR